MNRLKKNFVVPTLSLLMLLAACATTKPSGPVPEVALFGDEKPTQEVSLNELATSYGWELQNPTSKGATVRSIRWKFKMGDEIQEGEINDAGLAAAGGATTGALKIKSVMIPNAVSGGTPIVLRYRMQATFIVESAAGSEEMELSWLGELLAPQQPAVTAMAGAARYDTGTWEITINIDLTNHNSFDMEIDDFSYQLFLDDVDLEGGNLVTKRHIEAGATMQFDVGRILKKKTHKAVLAQIRNRPKIPFRLDASLTVDGEQITLPVYGNLEFD